MLSDIGLIFFIFIFPFSPKIPITIAGVPLLIRLDDIIVPLLFLAWLIELLLKKRCFVYSRLYIPIGVYFLTGLVSMLWGYYIKQTVHDPIYATCVIIRSAEYYIMFFLTVNILKTKKQIIRCINIWIIAAILISLYGISDHVLGISGPTGLYDYGWFDLQSNHMGGYLMVSLILAIGLLSTAQLRRTKIVSIIAIPLISYAILFNLSRVTYFSTLAALATFFLIKNRKLIIIPITLAVLLFLIIPTIFSHTTLGGRLNNVAKDVFSLRTKPLNQFDSMALHRAKFVEVFKDWPADIILGKGTGAYSLSEYDTQLALVPVSTGVVGTIVFIWLLTQIFKTAFRIHNSAIDKEVKFLAGIFIAIYVGVLVHSVTSTAFMIALIAYGFWVLFGILLSSWNLCQQQNN